MPAVVPAPVQEHDTLPALDRDMAEWPGLREAMLKSTAAERCRKQAAPHGMRHRMAARGEKQKDLVVLERQWVVENSFGWLTHRMACCVTGPSALTPPPGTLPTLLSVWRRSATQPPG